MDLRLIDVWDVSTFDRELVAELRANSDVICDYMSTEHRNFLERVRSDHRGLYPTNPYAKAYLTFVDVLSGLMVRRTIRAWHYTRLTDTEVDAIRVNGVHLSTLETAHQRLKALVKVGLLSDAAASALLAASPLRDRS